MILKEQKYITQTAVEQFNLLYPLLSGLYDEFQELSKKKSESPLNTYKVRTVNRILEPLKDLLKNELVLDYLDILDTDDMPTNSDVILILSHYLKAIKMFSKKYYEDSAKGKYEWAVK